MASIPILQNVDLKKNELQNARVQNLASAPASPVTGQLYYDTTTNQVFYWNGSAWQSAAGLAFGGAPGTTEGIGNAAAAGSATTASRSDHSHPLAAAGAPAASAVGDSQTTGVATTFAASDHKHAREAFGTPGSSAPGDAAAAGSATTVSRSDHVHGREQAYQKQTVRAVSTTNITLSGTQTIDGVSVVAGDRVLVAGQTTGANNGIYAVAAGAWTRTTDADTSAEVVSGIEVTVSEGTVNADTVWELSTNDPITLGTTSLAFLMVGAQPGTPGSSAVGDSATQGTAGAYSRSDHKHGREAFAAPTAETTYGTSSAAGSATTVPHSDHTHGNPTHVDADHSGIHLNALAAATADYSMGSHKITNLLDPTGAQDAATKNYVDGISQGVAWKGEVQAATTAALAANTYANGTAGVGATLTATANGALAAIDGYTAVAGDRLLIKNEVASANNGIYTVTQVGDGTHPYILTRAIDADAAAEIPGAAVLVRNGTTNGQQGFVVSGAGPYTMGTTAISFVQFTGVADITAGNGLTKSGNTLAVQPGSGILADGTSTRIDTSIAARYKIFTIGDGSSTSIVVNHALGNQWVSVQVMEATGSFNVVLVDVQLTDANNATIIFASAPASNAYKVIVVG